VAAVPLCREATEPTRPRDRRWATTALPIQKALDGNGRGQAGSRNAMHKTTIHEGTTKLDRSYAADVTCEHASSKMWIYHSQMCTRSLYGFEPHPAVDGPRPMSFRPLQQVKNKVHGICTYNGIGLCRIRSIEKKNRHRSEAVLERRRRRARRQQGCTSRKAAAREPLGASHAALLLPRSRSHDGIRCAPVWGARYSLPPAVTRRLQAAQPRQRA